VILKSLLAARKWKHFGATTNFIPPQYLHIPMVIIFVFCFYLRNNAESGLFNPIRNSSINDFSEFQFFNFAKTFLFPKFSS